MIFFYKILINRNSVADPGSGVFLTPGSGKGFFRIPDIGSRILTHIFES
jgi:hypothetical protein